MTERNSVTLHFVTNLGEAVSISVPRAKGDLTHAQAVSSMNDIIGSAIVQIRGGRPTSRGDAVLNLTTIDSIY